MDKFFHNPSGDNGEHPSPEMLLLMVDGELQVKDAAQLEAHLEACWPCRVKTQKIHDTIADIIEFDDQVLTPRLVPPQGWRNFDRKLTQLVAESGKQSLSSRFFGSLARILPSNYLLSSAPLRAALVIALVLLIVGLVMRLRLEPTVSATQLLHKSIEAEALKVNSTSDPVVHQRLRISRRDQTSEHAVELDIWRQANNVRIRQFVVASNQMVPIGSDISTQTQINESDRDLISDLQTVLKANHMDQTRPLSANSYQAWRDTLHQQRDEIIKSRNEFGIEMLSLHTDVAGPVANGQISEATLVVQASDWLPAELRFSIKTNSGSRSYQLTQTSSEVLRFSDVNPTIFSEQPVAITLPKAEVNKKETEATLPDPNRQPLTTNSATADLEVEALRLLHEADADLGEQISVQRNASGQLVIAGIVETEQRKKVIVNSLASIASNSAVRIDIQTVAEAVAQQQRMRARSTPTPVTEEIEINSKSTAASSDLRRHFESDEQMRLFAARMVSQSRTAMSHAYALEHLRARFAPERLRTLTPEARSKWLQLIRAHAQAYQNDLQTLRRELQRVYPAPSAPGGAGVAAIIDDASLNRAIEGLFAAGDATDATVRSSFSASNESATKSVIGPQFWRQLSTAEAFAARLAQVK